MKKTKLLLTLLCAGCALHSQAQHLLDYGKDYIGTPVERPYIYFDQLRHSYPYILREVRFNLNTNNWENYNRYYSVKNTTGQFSKLEIDDWDANSSSWEVNMAYNYNFTFNPANKFSSVKTLRSSDVNTNNIDTRQTFNYDLNNNLVHVIEEQAPSGTNNFTVASERFMGYDSKNRRTDDSTSYNFLTYANHYSYSGDTLINATSHLLYATLDQRDTGSIRKDQKGNILSLSRVFYADGARVFDSMSYTYNANNQVLSYLSLQKESDISIWEPLEKIEQEYRTDGQLSGWVRSLQSTTDSGKLELEYKLVIDYGNDNQADTAFSYFWTGSVFDTRAEQRYTFNDPKLKVSNLTKSTPIVKIYPNPATDRLTIETEQSGTNDIKIYDISGKIIVHQTTSGKEVGISQLQNGIYLISVNDSRAIKFEKR